MCSQALKQIGWQNHEFKEFPGMAHSACPEEIAMVCAFLKKHSETPSQCQPKAGGSSDAAYLCVPNNGKCYPVGQEVTIKGLKSKPELDGVSAIVLSFDKIKGRYAVKVKTNE